jgi:hypothetical protein
LNAGSASRRATTAVASGANSISQEPQNAPFA